MGPFSAEIRHTAMMSDEDRSREPQVLEWYYVLACIVVVIFAVVLVLIVITIISVNLVVKGRRNKSDEFVWVNARPVKLQTSL